MNEKRNRIAAAVTVSVVLLIAVLVAVLVYQLVTIAVLKPRRDQLESDLEYYEQLVEEKQGDLEWLQSDEYLRWLELQKGYGWKN